MSVNKLRGYGLILLVYTFLNQACAQTTGMAYVKEEAKVQQSLVLLNNEKYEVPLRNLETQKIASIRFAAHHADQFDSLLNKYTKVQSFNGIEYARKKKLSILSDDLKLYNTIIVQLTEADVANAQIISFITANQSIKSVIVAYSGKGSELRKLNDLNCVILWTDQTSDIAAEVSAQAIFGGIAVTQKLNADYSPRYLKNMGFTTDKTRLQYTVPEAAGINSANLKDIDKIAKEAMIEHGTPGCVVLVARDGKVIFNKAYGYHTYNNIIPDRITDIFDLASMTKISATTMEAMQLVDQGKLSLDGTIGDYLPIAKNTNKNDIKVRELLTHQAGLIPDIPTFEKIKITDHNVDSSEFYPTKVNENYFLRKGYFNDVMWPAMLNSPLKTRGQYVYSDLSMCFMQQIEETITAQPENVYVQKNLYEPLGMQTAGFLPLYRFTPDRIVPTEDDKEYRHALLDGYVHDPTAALMGGVAGHAGLFADINDVAILYQMMLNKGSYGGVEYIKPQTVELFTAKQSAVSRRGLGFDRWDPIADHNYPSKLASPEAYGHTGFTGTCVWVDPKYNLVYIFLSNRVNPNVSSKLLSLNIRPRIQDVVYEAIAKGL